MDHVLLAVWQPLGLTPLPWLAVTIAAYVLGQVVQRGCKGVPLANPVLIAILVVSGPVEATDMPYARYFAAAQFIQLLLGPATGVVSWSCLPPCSAAAMLKPLVNNRRQVIFACYLIWRT
jgi:LrgB-like family